MNTRRFGWPFFLMILVIVKGSLLWVDHHPIFFMGDSASYIWTALTGWIPPDRSFVYGYFIRVVAVTTNSLLSLVIVQVCLGGVAVIVLAHILIRYFNVNRWVAFFVAVLMSFEPLQLMYERYVMTETIALTAFSFYLWIVLHYLQDSRVRWLWMMQGVAMLLISIRFAFIPQMWICSVCVPIIAAISMLADLKLLCMKVIGRLVIHLIMSILALYIFTAGYKHINGYLQKKPPAYAYDGGFFVLSFILPIVEPNDFPSETLGNHVLNNLGFSQSDRRLRTVHRWLQGGVISQLRKLEPDDVKADEIARQTVINAIIRRPFALIQLGWDTFIDYFDRDYLNACIKIDVGDRKLEPKFQKLISKHFNYPEDRSSALDLKTISGRYFLHASLWFQCLLFLPIWVFIFLYSRDNVEISKVILLFLISALSVGVAIVLVERPTVRFLHISSWLFFLVAGVGLNRAVNFLEFKKLKIH
jgi:hypothetical protein